MRYAQLVMGPAGSGKSTYCSTMARHAENSKRRVDVVNLDPAAEHFDYQPIVDIKDLIQVEDVMEDKELQFGPNGGLVFCMEFLLENMDWLQEQLQDLDDDYVLFDCPGQIELYTHMKLMRTFVETLHSWNFRVCGVFLIDSHFMVDGSKFISGGLAALSVMVNLEVPHVNVLSKIDLLPVGARKQLDRFLEPDTRQLAADALNHTTFSLKFAALTEGLGRVLDDYSLVKFFPLDVGDEESIGDLLLMIDNTIQFGEEADVKTADFEERDPEQDDGAGGSADPVDYGR